MTETDNPAALVPHRPSWIVTAQRHLAAIRDALADLDGVDTADFQHIGSTAVPGLAAKPIVDLQVRITPLPTEAELVSRLGRIGFVPTRGSRPDSPGVRHDAPFGDRIDDREVWRKRLFVHEDGSVILHIRTVESPWGRRTVEFRDRLRRDDAVRVRYEAVKQELSAGNAGKPDYDDYTRAKTSFFDELEGEVPPTADASGG